MDPSPALPSGNSPPRPGQLSPMRVHAVPADADGFHVTSSVTMAPAPSARPEPGASAPLAHDPAKRLLDEHGYRFRAGCIAFTLPEGSSSWERDMRIVVVSSSSRAGAWILPAGGVERGETPADAAAREAMEEAGIAGPVWPLAWIHDPGKRARTALFALRAETVIDPGSPEAAGRGYVDAGRRSRLLVPLAEAEEKLETAPHQLAMFRAGMAALLERGDGLAAAERANGGSDGVVLPLDSEAGSAALAGLPAAKIVAQDAGTTGGRLHPGVDAYAAGGAGPAAIEVHVGAEPPSAASSVSSSSPSSSSSLPAVWRAGPAAPSLLVPHFVLCDDCRCTPSPHSGEK
jgi:8-oxo-dGTP pyrophosphatase MutT (NUDIX family)